MLGLLLVPEPCRGKKRPSTGHQLRVLEEAKLGMFSRYWSVSGCSQEEGHTCSLYGFCIRVSLWKLVRASVCVRLCLCVRCPGAIKRGPSACRSSRRRDSTSPGNMPLAWARGWQKATPTSPSSKRTFLCHGGRAGGGGRAGMLPSHYRTERDAKPDILQDY